MKQIKRLLALILALGILLALPACKKEEEPSLLEQAKQLIDELEYEKAYQLLYKQENLNEKEQALFRCFRYQPLKTDNGETVTNYEYDHRGNLLVKKETDRHGNTKTVEVNTYDENSNRLTRDYLDYNNKPVKEAYTYDKDGNRLTSEYTYSDGSWSKYSYTYDKDGNRLTSESTSSDGSWSKYSYTYDKDGNGLTSESTSSDGSWRKYSYTYDERGARTGYTYTSSDGTTTTVTQRLYYNPKFAEA